MSFDNQRELLFLKRTKKKLSICDLPQQYTYFESGKCSFGSACLDMTYPIIKILDLSMSDLEMILSD